jgi:2-keto-4-pentenoate hydratase
VMGHPAAALVWLAEALAQRGEGIEPGSVVLSGGLTASVLLEADGVVTAEFDGLGSIGVHCV